MKIGKLFKALLKMITVAIAAGSAAYIVKDILDARDSDNFDDTWEDDFDEDFDDLDKEPEAVMTREYVKVDPSKIASDSCEN